MTQTISAARTCTLCSGKIVGRRRSETCGKCAAEIHRQYMREYDARKRKKKSIELAPMGVSESSVRVCLAASDPTLAAIKNIHAIADEAIRFLQAIPTD